MNTSYYEELGVKRTASQDEIKAAFDQVIANRRSRRQKTSDAHAAYAVLSEPALRSAYELSIFGASAADKAKKVAEKAVIVAGHARDAMPEIDLAEVAHDAWQTTLKSIVLVTGTTAKVGELTASLSRRMQIEAARRIDA